MNGKVIRIVKRLSLLVLIFFFSNSLLAQDKIVTLENKTIKCRVTKVDADYVEYLDPQEIFGKIKKNRVKYIEFNKTPRKPIDYSGNTNKSIKLNLIALRENTLQLSYEKAFDALSSIELTAKVYGIAFRDFGIRKIGGGLDLGYRFRIGGLFSDTQFRSRRHVLDGIGIKPLVGASFAEKDNEGAVEKYYYVHIGSVLNYQVAFNNKLLLEIYGGLHVFKGKSKLQFPNTPELRGVLNFVDGDLNGEDNIAFSLGLKFGYLFGGFDRNAKLLRW